MAALYDRIGLTYADLRKPDPRIARLIDDALGDARTVLNVGAGAGSYEPAHRRVTALEPSEAMIRQRRTPAAAIVQGEAESLPFEDRSFDAAMAVLTVHHWSDQAKGLAEMRRVTRGPIVVLTIDPSFRGFWLTDYFPGLIDLDERLMPPVARFGDWLGDITVEPAPVPHDCSDGFLAGYWRRPAAYLDERVRAAISPFWAIGDLSDGLTRLEADLTSGAWERRYADLLEREELDCGYRLIAAP